jgi:hypothetical protein
VRPWVKDWNKARREDPRRVSYAALGMVFGLAIAIASGTGDPFLLCLGLGSFAISALLGSHEFVRTYRLQRDARDQFTALRRQSTTDARREVDEASDAARLAEKKEAQYKPKEGE